jgi:glycosyltransferase involved in cell wall biosynthesis
MHIVLFQFYSIKPNPVYKNLCEAFRARGHLVWLGEPNENGDLIWHDGNKVVEELQGFEMLRRESRENRRRSFLFRWYDSFCFILRIRKFLKTTLPDVVQVNPAALDWVIWFLPLFMPKGMKFVYEVKQINLGVSKHLLGRFREWLLLRIRHITARYIYDRACFHHVKAAEKIFGTNWRKVANVIPVGVGEEFLVIERSPQRSNDKIKFIYIGAITKFRSLEILLDAAKRVLEESDDFRMELYGPDKSDGYYHKLLDSLSLQPIVSINAAVPNESMPELLSGFDVGIAFVPIRPTWHYQPTLKILEYKAVGLPILSTDVASHREWVSEDVNGLLVKDTAEALAQGMLRFINDRRFFEQCTSNALATRRGITWDEVAERYEKQIYANFSLSSS